MAWRLTRKPQRVFPRNPLRAVITQLRFHPILKIADRMSDFQDRVRARFPVYAEATTRVINLEPPSTVEIREEKQFHFKKAQSRIELILGSSSLALESQAHTEREEFLADFQAGLQALLDVYSPVAATRLGLRYINIIDRETIARDLGRETAWSRLVTSDFLRLPSQLSDLDDVLFATEVTSPVTDGALTLRYGLLRQSPAERATYRFDIDRYLEATFKPAKVIDRLQLFADDIFSLFMNAAGPDLLDWMSTVPAQSAKGRTGDAT